METDWWLPSDDQPDRADRVKEIEQRLEKMQDTIRQIKVMILQLIELHEKRVGK